MYFFFQVKVGYEYFMEHTYTKKSIHCLSWNLNVTEHPVFLCCSAGNNQAAEQAGNDTINGQVTV